VCRLKLAASVGIYENCSTFVQLLPVFIPMEMDFGYPEKDKVPRGRNFTAFLSDSFGFITTLVLQEYTSL